MICESVYYFEKIPFKLYALHELLQTFTDEIFCKKNDNSLKNSSIKLSA